MNKPSFAYSNRRIKISILLIFSILCINIDLQAQTCAPYQSVPIPMPDAVVGNGTAASCTETALKAALANGGKVSCNCGSSSVTIPITSTITIAKTTILDGKGLVTLDAKGTTRHFNKNPAAEFTLQNLNLINGRADDKGGAIVCNNNGFFPAERLILINCNFTNNTCAKLTGQDIGGGAIYQLLLKELVVSGCTFTKNTGSNGGAIGGIGSDLTVINSTFTDNQATGENDLTAAPYGGIGGAIYTDNVHLYGVNDRFLLCNSKFIGNSSHVSGGAIHNVFHDNTKSKFIVDRTLFSGNFTRSATRGLGGAIYHQEDVIVANPAEDNVEITNSTFTKNYTAGQGGAMWTLIRGNGKISNSTFEGNKATLPFDGSSGSLGGALAVNTGFYIIENTTIANNRSEHSGLPHLKNWD